MHAYGRKSPIIKPYEELVKVKLVSYSQPSVWYPQFRDDSIYNLIAYCARVSNPDNQNNVESAERLIKYLIKNKHWSPFEMANICIEVNSSRDIIRQLLRHRSFTFQEFSQRYADPIEELEFCIKPARSQDLKNRQNSIDDCAENIKTVWDELQYEQINSAVDKYLWAINNGIAKEVARVILPEGNTMSRCYVNGTVRSWIHYLQLRLKNGTQLEHIMVAEECAKMIAEAFPLINKLIAEDKESSQ